MNMKTIAIQILTVSILIASCINSNEKEQPNNTRNVFVDDQHFKIINFKISKSIDFKFSEIQNSEFHNFKK